MVGTNLQNLQSEWESQQTKRTPKEMVSFLVMAGYAPFARVSKDQGIVVWVRKVYARSLHVYSPERYLSYDAMTPGGIKTGALVDDSGVNYDPYMTIKKLADFYGTDVDDFVSVPLDASLERVARNFVVLVDNSVVCDKSGCQERTFQRGLGGMIKL